jgi:hypothetical protein
MMRNFRNARTLLGVLAGALMMAVAVACSESGAGTPDKNTTDLRNNNDRQRSARERQAPETQQTKLPADAPADGAWGTIKGQVVYGGDKAPPMVPLKVDKDEAKCLETKKQLVAEDWVVDPETKGLKWAIVWLIPADAKKKPDLVKPIPIHPSLKNRKLENVVIDQPCCMFEPPCVALQDGQSLTIKNSMMIGHNSKVDGDADFGNPTVNPLIPGGAKVDIGPFHAQPSEVPLTCSIHSWMRGHIWCFSHPYYMVTGKDGKFEIKDAPAGKFRLVIWQPGAGWVAHEEGKEPDKFGTSITIKGGTTTDLGQFKAMPEEKK